MGIMYKVVITIEKDGENLSLTDSEPITDPLMAYHVLESRLYELKALGLDIESAQLEEERDGKLSACYEYPLSLETLVLLAGAYALKRTP